MAHFSISRVLRVFVLLLSIGIAACASAPVQEMSNARQAIKAARDAGAEKMAPQTLSEAEALLHRAEGSLQRREYREARREAVAARSKAAEALSAVQKPANNGSG
jgi:Domain of unknown function (DUF4398)